MQFYLALSLGPALLLLWWFQRWDAKRPEPAGSVRNVVLLGVASCIPAALIELVLQHLLGDLAKAQGSFIDAFVVAATTEETLKLLCVLVYLWKKPHFDEVMDGILYTAAASLGFAMLENVLYVGTNVATGILRAFTAVPMHAIASGLMGYFVGRARFSRGGAALWVLSGLAVAIGVHGLYDWALMSEGGFGVSTPGGAYALLEVLGLLAVCVVALRLARRSAAALDDNLLGPHARPLATEGAPRPYAGMPVLVTAADGGQYAATLVSGSGAHYLCALSDGRQAWIPWTQVRPATA